MLHRQWTFPMERSFLATCWLEIPRSIKIIKFEQLNNPWDFATRQTSWRSLKGFRLRNMVKLQLLCFSVLSANSVQVERERVVRFWGAMAQTSRFCPRKCLVGVAMTTNFNRGSVFFVLNSKKGHWFGRELENARTFSDSSSRRTNGKAVDLFQTTRSATGKNTIVSNGLPVVDPLQVNHWKQGDGWV